MKDLLERIGVSLACVDKVISEWSTIQGHDNALQLLLRMRDNLRQARVLVVEWLAEVRAQ